MHVCHPERKLYASILSARQNIDLRMNVFIQILKILK